MSARPFDHFLAKRFLDWAGPIVQPGYRYQFKSPNMEYATNLHDALIELANGDPVIVDGVELPSIEVGAVRLLPVLHGTVAPGFTENYISLLRDEVASGTGAFEGTALLLIHNSMLDTLVNSAEDLAAGGIWDPRRFKAELFALIDGTSSEDVLSNCLLEDQLALILEQNSTVFGFAPLYSRLTDGKLEFSELGLFKDPLLLSSSHDKNLVRRRLDENRKLRRDIEEVVENYGEQLEDKLKDFSSAFINKHFVDSNDWLTLEFEVFRAEKNKNAAPGLVFLGLDAGPCSIYERARSQSKAGQQNRSVIVEAPNGATEVALKLEFQGTGLEARDFVLKHNNGLKAEAECKVRKSRWVDFVFPFDGSPTYVTIDLRRSNRTECYQFHCLFVNEGQFYFAPIENHFRVEPKDRRITLQLEENQLQVHPTRTEVYVCGEDDPVVDVQTVGVVDFETIANQVDEITFELRSGEHSIAVNVEGATTDEGLKLPLLFDLDRFPRLFRDDYNGEYNKAKKKIVLDSNETSVVGVRITLLDLESRFLDDRLVSISDDADVPLAALKEPFPALHDAYAAWFEELAKLRTLPSLAGWGASFRLCVRAILDTYEAALGAIELDSVLTADQKRLLAIGMVVQGAQKRISPYHPLVLAYYLELVERILEDRTEGGLSSFTALPEVTMKRLTAAGLLPYVFDPESDYAQVLPMGDDAFWLNLIPQRDASYEFVRRLVRDKLGEFTKAYARLFAAGPRSSLIVNAINQGEATELFLGLMDYYKQNGDAGVGIHVNFYDESPAYNAFDRFSEIASVDALKAWFAEKQVILRGDLDTLLDLVRSRLTYSKFRTPPDDAPLEYAHLSFFKNNARVQCRHTRIEQNASGILGDGLIAGEAAETKDSSFFTAFGLRGVDYQATQALRIARLVGMLLQPALQNDTPYVGMGISLAVSTEFKQLLSRSYASSLWTTIIDPKVTLDFFTAHRDVVLIHYSDQYTASAAYDAITVTQHVEIFKHLVGKESLLVEFNAFNGTWLLEMLTANENRRKERNGIIGAYKFVLAMLSQSDIAWVPLSVAEIIRVSGNVGLKMTDSDFSRYNQNYKQGAISDDVLFVGFRGDELFLLPLEVKTGVKPDYAHACNQARTLRGYIQDELLGPRTLASKLYRSLFIRQVLIQLEKFRLYGVLDDVSMAPLLQRREWWLRGEYEIGELPGYPSGFVVAHVQSDSCFGPNYLEENEGILPIELPFSILNELIDAKGMAALQQIVKDCQVPVQYLLSADSDPEPDPDPTPPDPPAGKPSAVSSPSVENTPATSPPPPASPWQSPGASGVLQVLLGHDAFRGLPLYWEPTNTAKFMNTNSGIIGTMGTGKTQFTKSLITQLVRNHGDNLDGAPIGVLIFDYKSDYVDEAFVKASGAQTLKLHRLPYNPFSLYGDTPMLPVHTAAGFVETMARAYQLGPKQQTKLRSMILSCYEAAGIISSEPSTWDNTPPTLDHVWRRFNAQEKVEEDSLHAALLNLIEFQIFESDPAKMMSLYDLIDRVTVIELAKYPSEVQSLIVALTLDLFYSQMQKRGKPRVQGDLRQVTKMILVDEADNFMSQDFPALRKILKEGREYGVGVILSTQELTHFKTSENDYSSYVMTWVVHRVSQIKNGDIKAIFNKDDKNDQSRLMEEIRSLEKHYSLYIDGAKRVTKMRDKPFWTLEAELLQ